MARTKSGSLGSRGGDGGCLHYLFFVGGLVIISIVEAMR
jgi:hypothetical protein